ncbi:SulP family inorganic anion transporter [Phycisphaera mikurensis]|uniref:Putative sulfate transporter n=1 Tax=Phycisphaera mikurensis (strain NBRC 102666 / KCTC 22515 / FYK2301M01) TaxID=1142394 RepID=I0IGF8_PHYMF|nr:SulP family inorganic anion transporter [Phycisphaera mikurensis]MBB6442971.1 SulP family sulfate permease [Phycisphaera mikurensis]BAM04346.1 putative sulfate transporter [Phycisphaera mikurensis NBRC 102666]
MTLARQDPDPSRPASLANALAGSLQPVTRALAGPVRAARAYGTAELRGDAASAVTVALVALPQAVVFAAVAGVPPVVGVYTMVVGAVVGGLFTGSRFLSIGPTNTAAILIGGVVAGLGAGASAERVMAAVVAVTVLSGLLQVLAAVAHLGELVRYVSRSVIVGFAAGAGVLIAVKQLPVFLGVPVADVPARFTGVAGTLDQLLRADAAPSLRAVALGLLAVGVTLACKRASRYLPSYLVAIVAAAAAAGLLGWGPAEVAFVPEMPQDLPTPALPPLDLGAWRELLLPAAALALVGMIEACAIGKTLAARAGERIEPEVEFVAMGFSRVAAGLFGGMAPAASFSRSALAADAGARTRFSCVYAGVVTAVVFLALAPLARSLPMAAIAGVLFVIAYGLVDWRYARRLIHSNNADFIVCLGTFLATLILSLELAVFVGVFLNLALYLRRARQVFMVELVETPEAADAPGGAAALPGSTGYLERPLRKSDGDHHGEVVFLQLEGNLFFAAADELQDRFARLAAGEARAVILRLKRCHMVDATVMDVLGEFATNLRGRGKALLLCGVRPRMKERMQEYGLVDLIGEHRVHLGGEGMFHSSKAAVAQARRIVRGEAEEDTAASTRGREWAYDI